MPTMLEMIKASAVPANLMRAAANGSLSMPAVETLEVLVYLTHNKLFGEQARMTLAGWDLEATQATVKSPDAPQEILKYYLNPLNIRPKLLPYLIENPAVADELLIVLAAEGPRDVVRAMLASERVRASHKILEPLSLNVHVTEQEASQVHDWLSGTELRVVGGTESELDVGADFDAPLPAAVQDTEASATSNSAIDCEDASEEAMAALTAFEREHAAELAAQANVPFKPIGGTYGLDRLDESSESQAKDADADSEVPAAAASAVSPGTGGGAAAAAPAKIKSKPKNAASERVSVLQKIAKLDVKGRVQLAVRGSKEERAILVRDGTKLVALAVLQSPKISDGEVEKFANQKNVLEALLRGITMHRRFMKNYNVVRNLTSNPRTPIDLSLGLIKNLMVQDLKNLSNNKEVSETIRKMALRAFKQKTDATKK